MREDQDPDGDELVQLIDPLSVVKVEALEELPGAFSPDNDWQTQRGTALQGLTKSQTVLLKEESRNDPINSQETAKNDQEQPLQEEVPLDFVSPEVVYIKVESQETPCDGVDLYSETEESTQDNEELSADLTVKDINRRREDIFDESGKNEEHSRLAQFSDSYVGHTVDVEETVCSATLYFQCKTCFKVFARKSDLIEHKKVHAKKKTFICKICKKGFSHRTGLGAHQVVHTGEKPFKCDICSKKFSLKHNLVSHLATHVGLKPFECEICNKPFALKSTLNKHHKTHFKFLLPQDKSFQCVTCGKQFAQRQFLVQHQAVHSGVKPFQCEICQRSFTHKGNLTQHRSVVHFGIKAYKCDSCERSFSKKLDRERHNAMHHSQIT